LSKPVTHTEVSHCIWVWCTQNARTLCLTPFAPLLNSHINNVLIKTAPGLKQPLFQFINAVDVCMINTLMHGRLYLIWQSTGLRCGIFRCQKSNGMKSGVSLC